VSIDRLLKSMLNTDDFRYSAIKGDASKRKFYKVTSKKNKYILMDSSQEIRSYRNYLKFHKIFSKNLNLPVIYQKNNKRNVVLMEDLGVKLINDELKNSYNEKLYEKLILNIIEIQKIPKKNIYLFTKDRYFRECLLYINYLITDLLEINVSTKDFKQIQKEIESLIQNIYNHKKFVIHRDYHSKNLFYINKKIFMIDFQDALIASEFYDICSILKDCYLDISANQIEKLLMFYCDNSNFKKKSFDACFFEFNESCIQRHMKAAGIFARLLVKEKRNSHIKYIPRTVNYIIEETNNTKFSLINKYSTLVRDKLNASNNISSW